MTEDRLPKWLRKQFQEVGAELMLTEAERFERMAAYFSFTEQFYGKAHAARMLADSAAGLFCVVILRTPDLARKLAQFCAEQTEALATLSDANIN